MSVASVDFPERGVIFWPVGSGDSTTIVVDADHVIQVDIRDMDLADDDDSDVTPVIDELVEKLPRPNGDEGKPYLSVFVLTHADEDHCRGFAELLERVDIGEIWSTPRVWRDYEAQAPLCDDAKAFREETQRRVDAVLDATAAGREVVSGERIYVVGYDSENEKHAYSELPDEYLLYPTSIVTKLDGDDMSQFFEAFIHAPFAGDCAAERNDTSLAMQVVLKHESGVEGKLLLFGDLAYETLIRIFEASEGGENSARVDWNAMLAPHHCSGSVMFVTEDDQKVFKSDIMDKFQDHALDGATIVFSSREFPATDVSGANPPHNDAREQYETIVDAGHTVCTAEHPTVEEPTPVVFGLDAEGLHLLTADELEETKALAMSTGAMAVAGGLALLAAWGTKRLTRKNPPPARERQSGLSRVREAVSEARDDDNPPTTVAGFGGE